MGHALCVVCQDAVLDFCEDQSHHLMLLVQRECFNLCYELSARDDSEMESPAHLAGSQVCGSRRIQQAPACAWWAALPASGPCVQPGSCVSLHVKAALERHIHTQLARSSEFRSWWGDGGASGGG